MFAGLKIDTQPAHPCQAAQAANSALTAEPFPATTAGAAAIAASLSATAAMSAACLATLPTGCYNATIRAATDAFDDSCAVTKAAADKAAVTNPAAAKAAAAAGGAAKTAAAVAAVSSYVGSTQASIDSAIAASDAASFHVSGSLNDSYVVASAESSGLGKSAISISSDHIFRPATIANFVTYFQCCQFVSKCMLCTAQATAAADAAAKETDTAPAETAAAFVAAAAKLPLTCSAVPATLPPVPHGLSGMQAASTSIAVRHVVVPVMRMLVSPENARAFFLQCHVLVKRRQHRRRQLKRPHPLQLQAAMVQEQVCARKCKCSNAVSCYNFLAIQQP